MSPIRAALVAAILVVLATGAARAECVPASVSGTIRAFQDRGVDFGLYLGRITAAEIRSTRAVSLHDGRIPGTETVYAARFVGHRGTARGFREPVDLALRIDVTDFPGLTIPSGEFVVGKRMLALFEHGPEGPVFTPGACGSGWFAEPTRLTLRRAQWCLAGGWCPRNGPPER